VGVKEILIFPPIFLKSKEREKKNLDYKYYFVTTKNTTIQIEEKKEQEGKRSNRRKKLQ